MLTHPCPQALKHEDEVRRAWGRSKKRNRTWLNRRPDWQDTRIYGASLLYVVASITPTSRSYTRSSARSFASAPTFSTWTIPSSSRPSIAQMESGTRYDTSPTLSGQSGGPPPPPFWLYVLLTEDRLSSTTTIVPSSMARSPIIFSAPLTRPSMLA